MAKELFWKKHTIPGVHDLYRVDPFIKSPIIREMIY